jgi:hypothetical protein
MYSNSVKKISIIMLAGLLTSLIIIPLTQAEGITLDGVVDEPEYTLWFEDLDKPKFTVYTTTDDTNVYIGILFDDSDAANDLTVIAFKADKYDWLIELKDGETTFRPNGGGYYGWWQHKRWGLPPDVSLATGMTNGYTSLEICMPKEMMGAYSEEFPINAEVWLKYQTEDGGNTNYYPQSLADWFFVVNERTFTMQEEEPPKFHAPEVPYGTILTLSMMAAALFVYTKRSKLPF